MPSDGRVPNSNPLRRFIAVAATICALGACSTGRYAGVDLRPGAAPPDLQRLAEWARAGDKRAQLDLGIRYETGDGVAVDPGRARSLYLAAASRTGGKIFVYSPPVGKNGRGQVIPLDGGPDSEGLPEAKTRLEQLGARDRRN